MESAGHAVTVEELRAEARRWFGAHAEPRPAESAFVWGEGPDTVALFHTYAGGDEGAVIDARRAWIRAKADAGLANVHWEEQWGGRGLTLAHARAVDEEESAFITPLGHEAISITLSSIGPTIRAVGSEDQKRRYLRRLLRVDDLWCQLFSEPDAGSDLAGLSTRAEAAGHGWVLNGQKVWTSGAQFADYGYVLARTDPDRPKHEGLTAFIVPMHGDGVEVRPLRQMTGGASFNEVYLSDVRVDDADRLGPRGDGWRTARTTLSFERGAFGGFGGRGRTCERLIGLARQLGRDRDVVVRQQLAAAYTHERLLALNRARVQASVNAGQSPGPEGSISKLMWTRGLELTNEVASSLLGPAMSADTGAWGTYAWTERLLGVPGYRLAGGTDEVQRNVLGERVLGLPAEPRIDREQKFGARP